MRSVWIIALFLCLMIQTTVPAPVSNSTDCDPPSLKCQSGECIPKERICDGMFDCFDGEDETNCTSSMEEKCISGYSKCSTENICVPNILLCDGDKDCPDGSDEANCEDQQSDYSCSASDSFVCKTTKENQQKVCLPRNVTCNGIRECPLGDDEDGCEDLRGCSVREHKCQHFCEDRPGSFVCGCTTGYTLQSDGRSCKYDSEASSAGYLLVGYDREIHQFPLANLQNDANHSTFRLPKLEYVLYLDYMRHSNEIILMTVKTWQQRRQQGELRVLSNGKMKTLRENIHEIGVVAVDWIGKNVFFTQDLRSTSPGIHACTMNGLFCRRIIKMGSEYKSTWLTNQRLVVHPMRGLIIWIEDIDHGTHIKMSNMDGSEMSFLIKTDMKRIINSYALAIDHVKNDVYFLNLAGDSVERINIDTKEVHVVFSNKDMYVWEMIYLNGFLYWSDWRHRSLRVQEIAHKHSSPHVVQNLNEVSFSIAINHSLHQIEPSSNPCHELDCPWLCIVIPKSSSDGITAKCICPDGYTPSGDTCIPFSPFDEMEILKNYSHIGFELMSEYCKRGIGCKNGGTCRELLNETRIVCDCKLPFDGQYCERIIPEMHAAMKAFRTQISVFAVLFICILVLLIVGCGALVKFANRKLEKTRASPKVNFVNGERIQMENRPTTFNNPSFDDESNVSSAFSTSSSASFSTTIRFEDDGSLL